MKILVTGASGFIGSAVCRRLRSEEIDVLPVYRNEHPLGLTVGNINGTTDWCDSLMDITHVVHTAARVHVMKESVADPLLEFRRTNVDGTLNLARQAVASGVKRFVFISSVKVNGEQTKTGRAFTEENTSVPTVPYDLSKYEAEIGLRKLALEENMEIVIIRPPLVYGPGVRANFLSLMKLVSTGFPLPLGGIDNQRSMVSLDNIVDLIITCINHPAAANEIFLVSDGEDLSVTELLRRLASAMDVPSRLIPFPLSWLQFALSIVGKKSIADRLCGSLQVDITKARTLLGWSPPWSLVDELEKTAKFFQENSSK